MVFHLDSTKSAWNSPIVLCWSLISIVKISNCVRHTHTHTHTHTRPLPPAVSCQFLLSVQHTHKHANCSFSWHADERRLRLLAACHQSATHEHQSDVIGLTDRALFITLTVNPAVCSEMSVKCLQKVVFLSSVSCFFNLLFTSLLCPSVCSPVSLFFLVSSCIIVSTLTDHSPVIIVVNVCRLCLLTSYPVLLLGQQLTGSSPSTQNQSVSRTTTIVSVVTMADSVSFNNLLWITQCAQLTMTFRCSVLQRANSLFFPLSNQLWVGMCLHWTYTEL